jgi:aryl-alcohol dehydrogenase (NADP+)
MGTPRRPPLGIGVMPYSPLARGILPGRYASVDQLPEGSRAARRDKRMLQTELRPESIALAQTIPAHAQAHGSTASRFALQLVARARSSNVDALDAPFTAADEALVDGLVPAGHPWTPGFTDPQYPVTGRVARTA